ncbi:STAS domain-containing protein [Actinomadura oligospora]|uniref:STAS domain-containing protein n=1 Tax=Actinomadura oligospora TaxID=111804 RepID=UPI0004B011F8|nr:STAS domain-containing protein [Actinomadura oligospora]
MTFTAYLSRTDVTATVHLTGELDTAAVPQFRRLLEQAAAVRPRRLVLRLDELTAISPAGLRCLAFAPQLTGRGTELILAGVRPELVEPLTDAGHAHAVVAAQVAA